MMKRLKLQKPIPAVAVAFGMVATGLLFSGSTTRGLEPGPAKELAGPALEKFLQSPGVVSRPIKGDAALAQLKERGQDQSLAQAMQAARYAVEAIPGGLGGAVNAACYAGNPAHALRCWFRADGVELQPSGAKQWELHLRLLGYGRTALEKAEVGQVSAPQNRVELSRANGAVVEWYENRPAGLEQGFTLPRRPQGEGPLRLVLEAEGDVRPELDDMFPLPWGKGQGEGEEHAHTPSVRESGGRSGMAVKFVTADGRAVLRYSGLSVWDAAQRALPAHLEVQGRQLALVVNDQDATYPITIDPLITSQQAKLTAADGAAADEFGLSVSLSGDGNTALVGAFQDDTPAGANAGSAYVFVRSGSTWSEQYKLTAADGAVADHFGCSVSLSGDGNTALVGAYTAGAYVFVRSGSTWSQQYKLTANDTVSADWFGMAVSLSGDGNTALVGASQDDTPAGTDAGSAYVFVRNGTTWSQQYKVTAADGAPNDHFGEAVGLSGDGNTALVGAGYDDTPAGDDVGSAYVFVRSGSTWSQQYKLTAGDGAADDQFGLASVSLSGDGNTALVGAFGDDTAGGGNAGSAYVFVRSGSSWSQQHKLTASDGAGIDYFGISVSLTGDGNTALVGAYHHDTPAGGAAGCAYVFVRSGSTWSPQGQLTAGDGAEADFFGYSVSLSGDGNTALVGALCADTPGGAEAGSAYVFRLGAVASVDLGLRAYDGTGIVRIACEALTGGSSSSLFRFSKNGTSYGIVLVDPSSPDASRIRMQTPAGVKAWMKLP